MSTHPRPLVQGNSGAIYCAACLLRAANAAELDTRPCYADMMED